MTRPAIEAGEKLGFLPGDLQSKIDPYLRPLYDALYDVLGRDSALRLKEKGANINTILETLYDNSNINSDIINNVVNKHFKSEFKRKQLPIKITRDEIV